MSRENEPAWKRFIKSTLFPGEPYDGAESYYTKIDPYVQEILDAKRLMELGEHNHTNEETKAGALRLKDAVVNILGDHDAKARKGYAHAMVELSLVRMFFPNDPIVDQIYKRYYDDRGQLQY